MMRTDHVGSLLRPAAVLEARDKYGSGSIGLDHCEKSKMTPSSTPSSAEGAFVGLPLWQTPTIENSVRFLTDLSEAVPEMPIMVYVNSRCSNGISPLSSGRLLPTASLPSSRARLRMALNTWPMMSASRATAFDSCPMTARLWKPTARSVSI